MGNWKTRNALLVLIVIVGVAGILYMKNRSTGMIETASTETVEQPRGPIANTTTTRPIFWTAFSSLPVPPSKIQISFWPEGSYVLAFNYDGSIPQSRVLSKQDPHYPNDSTIRLTAFFHSSLAVEIPPEADITTLVVSSDGSFIKDKYHVFYSDCEGLSCGYNLLVGADPQSFEQLESSDQYTGSVRAMDAKQFYSCTPVQCDEGLRSD